MPRAGAQCSLDITLHKERALLAELVHKGGACGRIQIRNCHLAAL